MTEKEYRSHPAISRSALWEIRKSPAHFRYKQDNPIVPTPALVFGQLFHSIALQPELTHEQFVIEPELDKRTKIGKEAYAEFVLQNTDKTIVTVDMVEQALNMAQAVTNNEVAYSLISGEVETPYFWTDEHTGEPCKCRTDVVKEIAEQQIIVDLKSCTDASTEAFVRDAIKFGYDVQAAMYSEGVKANTGKDSIFVFVAVEKEPPYAVNVIQADKLFMQSGWSKLRDLMAIYHDCNVTGNWYGYTGKTNIINNTIMPSWAIREIE